MEHNEWEEVFTANNSIEAGYVKSLLNSSGIECIINNLHYASLIPLGSGAVPIKIVVDKRDKSKAKIIIEQYYRDLREQ